MKKSPKLNLFSSYGQIRLGPEQLLHLRVAEGCGDGHASAELGAAYLDGNGVEQDVDRAIQHFNVGAKAGNKFCAFRLAEWWFMGDYGRNQHASIALRTSYDKIWLAAKGGVGEAFVTLHFLHRRLAESPAGIPEWVRPEAEKMTGYFMSALSATYAYQEGGDPTASLAALERLAQAGFAPAYHAASIVAAEGCREVRKAQAHLRTAVELGVEAAIEAFMESSLKDDPANADLLELAGEYGDPEAEYLVCVRETKTRGEQAVGLRLLRLLKSAPRNFSRRGLSALEWLSLKGLDLDDLPDARPEATRLLLLLASLGHAEASGTINSRRVIQNEANRPDTQLAKARDIGRVFLAALSGSSTAWKTLMVLHAEGTLCGHTGLKSTGEQRSRSALGAFVSGLMAEALSGEACVPEFLKQGFLRNGSIDWTNGHLTEEVQAIERYQVSRNLQHAYGHGFTPPDRLIHEASRPYSGVASEDYPWAPPSLPAARPWRTYGRRPASTLSRSPFQANWLHPSGKTDVICQEIHRRLSAGDVAGAMGLMRFDQLVIPRLMTLASGLYQNGQKREAAELLAFACFHLDGQNGLAHHMLAWANHEAGRTNDAIRVATDCSAALRYEPQTDTNPYEFNLLLAEMLTSLNRTKEAETVIATMTQRLHATGRGPEPRLARLEEYKHLDLAEWFELGFGRDLACGEANAHTLGKPTATKPQPGHVTSLSLNNMDRHRCAFPRRL
jgi:TPR repeat protein